MVTAPTALYRLYNAEGDLLYVGVTANLGDRFWNHQLRKRWWPAVATRSVELFDHREDALMAERIAIRSETPVFNIAGVEQEQSPPDTTPVRITMTVEEADRLEVAAAEHGMTVDAYATYHVSAILDRMANAVEWNEFCEKVLGLDRPGEPGALFFHAVEAGLVPPEDWMTAILRVVVEDDLWDDLDTPEARRALIGEVKERECLMS